MRNLEQWRYRNLAQQAQIGGFIWDLQTGSLLCDALAEKFFQEMGSPVTIRAWWQTQRIHPENRAAVRDFLCFLCQPHADEADREITYSLDCRFKMKGDRFLWIHLLMVIEFHDRWARKIAGSLWDVTHQQEHQQYLERMARQDPLTGLYHKKQIQGMIADYLQKIGRNVSALLVIDIDDLKVINDTFGHLRGDAVIVSLAKTLKTVLYQQQRCSRF